MSVDVNNESGVDADEALLVALARHVLDAMRIHPLAELSIALTTVEHMTALHEKYLDEPGPTDVMSFPQDELRPGGGPEEPEPEPGLLGDVVLCPEVAATQAAAAGHGTEEELHLLLVHGILHLLGYDHAEPDEERAMFDLQRRLLLSWAEERRRTRGAL